MIPTNLTASFTFRQIREKQNFDRTALEGDTSAAVGGSHVNDMPRSKAFQAVYGNGNFLILGFERNHDGR